MGRGSNLSYKFSTYASGAKGTIWSTKGTIWSTKGTIWSLTKDRKGTIWSTKSATLRRVGVGHGRPMIFLVFWSAWSAQRRVANKKDSRKKGLFWAWRQTEKVLFWAERVLFWAWRRPEKVLFWAQNLQHLGHSPKFFCHYRFIGTI